MLPEECEKLLLYTDKNMYNFFLQGLHLTGQHMLLNEVFAVLGCYAALIGS
jgi:hypothetical protein